MNRNVKEWALKTDDQGLEMESRAEVLTTKCKGRTYHGPEADYILVAQPPLVPSVEGEASEVP